MIYTYNGIILALKKGEHSDKCYHMTDVEDVILSEIKQPQADEYYMIPDTEVWAT